MQLTLTQIFGLPVAPAIVFGLLGLLIGKGREEGAGWLALFIFVACYASGVFVILAPPMIRYYQFYGKIGT